MYKDPSEFRERFKAYKEGKSVREIYGLPEYHNGKFSAATKKKIDYYYNKLIANGFDPMSAVGILGNMMQESSLDPDSVNLLGYSGLLLNSKAIRLAIVDLYGDYSEQSLLRYLSDWTDGSTWIRKGPHAQHTALYSKSYLRKGYKTPEEAAFLFLKRYERAIVVDPKTKKALRDKNGEYIYQDKDKRIGYARDIYDYVTGAKPLRQLIFEVGQTQPEPIIATPDVTRVAATIPLEKTITYTDNRNTVGAEIDRSIWAHNVMNDIQGMSYDIPIWESKSLPALEPIELDVTPFKTYGDGKISQGHKLIPIDKARAWAMHHDADEPWYERYGKNVADAVLGTIETFTEPYRNAVNGRMNADDALSIGLDLGAGIGAKAIRKASKMIKPTKASVSLKGKSPREVGRYFELNPDLTTEPNALKLAEATEFIKQDALPRVKLAAKKKGKSVDFDPNSVTFREADFKDSKLGGVSTPNKTVYMRAGSPTNHYVHELAHEMRRMTGETPEEASRLFTTYKNSGKFIKDHPEFMQLAEDEAVNTELRYLVSHANGGAKGKALDKIIDNMSYDLFETYAILANAYTNDMAMSKGINKDTFKNTLKYVGVGVPGISSVNRENWYKNGKLPKYEDGLTPFELFLYNLSSETMLKGRLWGTGINLNTLYNGGREKDGGVAQSTYLLPRSILKKVFHNEGYIDGQSGDYGLVKSAVGNRNIPVFLTAPDSIKRESLTHLGNILDGDWETSYIGDEKELVHAGGFPSAIYIDGSTGILYQKQWDLNDYGNYGSGTNYDGLKQVAANVLDKVGNPVVVTSGYLPVLRYNLPQKLKDLINPDSYTTKTGYMRTGLRDARTLWKIINKGLEDKGLHLENLDGEYVPMLTGIEVILDRNTRKISTYSDGKISIKPSKRGTFTAAAKKHGASVAEFERRVLKNPEKYSKAMVKKARFSHNARSWKH